MFSNPNPHYFIVLSQSDSISAAAEKLHVSHQNLSKYIKNLEQEYRITLFTRMPRLKLTEAGEAMLETMRELAFSEENLQIRLEEIRHAKTGKLRVGTPEGRFRIIFPELLVRMKELYPQVRIEAVAAPSHALQKLLRENELDRVLIDRYFADLIQFRHLFHLDERLFLVISQNLLQTVFLEKLPERLTSFQQGIHLEEFAKLPFILNEANSISRYYLDRWQAEHQLQLPTIMELPQLDMQILLSARDYGASFCWSMYLPSIRQQNRLHPENPLYAFPILEFPARNQVILAALKNKKLSVFAAAFARLLREQCEKLSPS